MIVVLAFVFMIMPLVVEFICEQAAKRGRGPLAEPACTTVETSAAGPVFTDPRDAERCAAESRLVCELLDGRLDRPRYQAEMAALAAGAVSPPVRLPGDSGEPPV